MNLHDATNAVHAIETRAHAAVVDVDKKEYVTRPVFLPPEEPNFPTLSASNLSSIVRLINLDWAILEPAIGESPLMIQILSPTHIEVSTPALGREKSRNVLIRAKFEPPSKSGFSFGTFYDVEGFIIALQALFAKTTDRDSILALIGNLNSGVVKNFSDDGITQTVEARTGITRAKEASVPNPVFLAPFRTFTEIEQPQSPFVFRMKPGSDSPMCALFEADGGNWREIATKTIADFFEREIPALKSDDKKVFIVS